MHVYDKPSRTSMTSQSRTQTTSDSNMGKVEKIMETRLTRKGQREYLVKWRGISSRFNSWKLEEDIADSKAIIKEFNKSARRERSRFKKTLIQDSNRATDHATPVKRSKRIKRKHSKQDQEQLRPTESHQASRIVHQPKASTVCARSTSKASTSISLNSSKQHNITSSASTPKKPRISKYDKDDDWTIERPEKAKTPKTPKAHRDGDDQKQLFNFYLRQGSPQSATKSPLNANRLSHSRKSFASSAMSPLHSVSYKSLDLLSKPNSVTKKKTPHEIVCKSNDKYVIRYSDGRVLTVSQHDLLNDHPRQYHILIEAYKQKQTPRRDSTAKSPWHGSESSFVLADIATSSSTQNDFLPSSPGIASDSSCCSLMSDDLSSPEADPQSD